MERDGFRKAIVQSVSVLLNVATTLDIKLEIGLVTEAVQVTGETGRVNTTDASLGNVLVSTQIMNLPLEGRDPAALLSLQAGVVFLPTGTTTNPALDSRSGSVSGSRSDQSNITLDGADNNDPIRGIAFTGAVRAPLDSIQEIRVITSSSNADQGRSSAAQVALVTRSGTNQWHGSAYYAHRNEALAANEFFLNSAEQEKRKLRKHIFGGRLGLPILKDRLFIFGNYEERRDIREAAVLRDVPSWAMRHGFLNYPCAVPASCPGGVASIAGRNITFQPGTYMITPSQIAAIDPLGFGGNAATLAWFQQYPEANDPAAGFDGINILGYRFAAPVRDKLHTALIRADWNVDANSRHLVFVRGILNDDSFAAAPQFPGQPPNTNLVVDTFGIAAGYRVNITTNLTNNFVYGINRIKNATQGLQTAPYVNFRFLDDLEGFGTVTSGRTLPAQSFNNDMVWTRGNHTMSFGGAIRLSRNKKFTNANSFHFFTSNPSWVPNEGAAVTPGEAFCNRPACNAVPAVSGGFTESYHDAIINLMGLISQATGAYNFTSTGQELPVGAPVLRRFATNEFEIYLQDQWRIHPTLTLTAGLRYAVYSPPWETNGQQVAPTPGLGNWFETRRQLAATGLPSSAAPLIQFDLGGPANNGPHYYEYDYNNIMPRLALAWSPRWSDGWLGALSGNGRLVFRAGYGIVYDRVGNSLVNQFDQLGSFGLSTSIDSTFGACDEGFSNPCPRFNGNIFDVPNSLLPSAPPPSFPSTPPGGFADGSFAITSALDSSIRTPYAHTFNVTLGRELPGGFAIEGAYVGRRGRKLLLQRDLAMPTDLVDSASGVNYFSAATRLVELFEDQNTPIANVAPIPYWENLFPGFGPGGFNGGQLPCDIFGVDPGFMGGFSATQVAYDFWNCVGPDYTFALFLADRFCFPECSKLGPFAFFNDQYSALSGWSSIGKSEYHAFQLNVRKRFSAGLSLDFNYTYSKSRDHQSEAEYAGAYGGLSTGGVTGFMVNSWDIDSYYSFSDFDMRHQINANWYWEIPYGRGRRYGTSIPGWANQVIGGWSFAGLFRWTSGLPATVGNGRVWPTNWNLTGNATCITTCPATQTNRNGSPNIFRDATTAFGAFRRSRPGEAGNRNILRGDGFIGLDVSIAKRFPLPFEGHFLRFNWDIFNLPNFVRFDTGSLNMNLGASGAFGNYTNVLGPPDGGARVMQFSLRYEF